MKTNSKRMKIARAKMGLGVKEVAKRVGICWQHYYKIERGEIPRPHDDTVGNLASVFGVTRGQILGLESWR